MAEIVVGIVKDKLASWIREGVSSLSDVDKEVAEIARELVIIHSVLKDADRRAETEGDNIITDGVKEWVNELREIAFEVEDVVSEYRHHHMAELPHHPNNNQQGLVGEFLQRIASFLFFCCSRLKQRHELAMQIKGIKSRLSEFHTRSERYGFKSIQQGSTSTTTSQNTVASYYVYPQMASDEPHEKQLVGIESARDELIGILLDESSQFRVTSVVGMGGSGKTTLAQEVYNHAQGSFQCHAWIQVRQPYDIEAILKALIRELFKSTNESIPWEIDTMAGVAELIYNLRAYLRGKKYLVIFDDVRKEVFWGDIGYVLMGDNVGGRILITTRNMEVAKFRSSFHIHKMQPLPKQKAWELFCKQAFGAEDCPRQLKEISDDIVERCEGLPLAIKLIARLLSTKNKIASEWRKLHNSLGSELGKTNTSKILSFSYNDLPNYYIKSCFLYFGMFPQHHTIRHGRLIRQWIAEGFVKPGNNRRLEEVAQEHMKVLIDRSLVEVSLVDVKGKPKECRVHDLLHELILDKMNNLRFCQVLQRNDEPNNEGGEARRLSINNCSNDMLEGIKSRRIHSILVFYENKTLNSEVPVFATNFKFLKVLDFENAQGLGHLPEDIGKLFDLRYLSVRGTKVKMLPKSLGKLENLETLDLKRSLVSEIPAEVINTLCKLRCLYTYYVEDIDGQHYFKIVGAKLEAGFGSLKALRKLYHIEADAEVVDRGLFKELKNLTQLRTLGIIKLRNEDGRELCSCIERMEQLESLTICATSENEFIDLESISSPPKFLERLSLFGRLRKLPECFTEFRHLIKIRLAYSTLEDDPIEVLQNMHNLLQLFISHNAYVGEKLHFKEGVFPILKKLSVEDLGGLRSLIIEETALPKLETLLIGPCPRLDDVPLGLQHLRKLKTLFFVNMSPDYMMLQDFRSALHVPSVIFSYIDEQAKQQWLTLPILLEYQVGFQKERAKQNGASTSGNSKEEQHNQ